MTRPDPRLAPSAAAPVPRAGGPGGADGPARTQRGPVVAQTREELAAALAVLDATGTRKDYGRAVVMTMGALHAGHLSLVARAHELAEHVVVTIFVNPLQFSADEDLDRYPRDLGADLAVLGAAGVDVVFAPPRDVVFPAGEPVVRVNAGRIGRVLEGVTRPGHLDGVLTVVLKLVHLTRPDVSVFGQKDAQQVMAVQAMVRDLDVPVAIRTASTVRDADGLALSSRNAYLSADERVRALVLSRALRAAERVALGPAAGADAVRAAVAEQLAGAQLELDYAALVDPRTAEEVPADHRGPALLAIAARVGGTHLIDNVLLRLGESSEDDA